MNSLLQQANQLPSQSLKLSHEQPQYQLPSLIQQSKPAEGTIFDFTLIDPQNYQLNQSYFTYQQLIAQEGYQVIKHNDYLYFGGINGGLRHGWGVLITKCSLYEGLFSLHHKMGKGFSIFPNGSSYQGDFANDKPHGHGVLSLHSESYIGDFQNGAMQGDGLWNNGKGQKYVGMWKNNQAHGQGVYLTKQSYFQGTFQHISGNFSQFIKEGYGVEIFQNGDQYKGYYHQGRPHGKGEYVWKGGAIYQGEFKAGLRQGEGRWISEHGDQFQGHFSADRKNGMGQFQWVNGNFYRGWFCEDMREGQGHMEWADGSIYEGEWKRGLPNGQGVFLSRGSKPRAGFFKDNVLVSQQKVAKNPTKVQNEQQKLKVGMGRGKSVHTSGKNSGGVMFKVTRRSFSHNKNKHH